MKDQKATTLLFFGTVLLLHSVLHTGCPKGKIYLYQLVCVQLPIIISILYLDDPTSLNPERNADVSPQHRC